MKIEPASEKRESIRARNVADAEASIISALKGSDSGLKSAVKRSRQQEQRHRRSHYFNVPNNFGIRSAVSRSQCKHDLNATNG